MVGKLLANAENRPRTPPQRSGKAVAISKII
jgi:hypothetical protein